MKFTNRLGWRFVLAGGAAALAIHSYVTSQWASAQGVTRFAGPTSSQPLALSADGNVLAVVNPDNESVTIFDVEADRNVKIGDVHVGQEPNGVAVSPDGRRAWVANTVSGTVSAITVHRSGPHAGRVITNIPVGTEPYSVVPTPNGTKLYVANARSNNISVIDAATNRVIKTIDNVGFEPRGLAVTNDGDGDDDDETLLVTQFLSLPVAVGKLDGEDDSKVGLVTSISTGNDSITGTIILRPLANTGFLAAGDAIAKVAPPAAPQPADFRFQTGAYPNQMNNLVIRGRFAFLPNTGASPNGPTRFNVNTQALLNVVDINDGRDAGQTINMHLAVARQTNADKLFVTQPWAIAAKHRASEAYVVSAASNTVIKVNFNPANGAPTVPNNPSDATRVMQVGVGKNPRGIVINESVWGTPLSFSQRGARSWKHARARQQRTQKGR
ncbi:MAG: hypothetical protein FJW39_28015 [Acidobacteria bacterium]|nr:hypothetical protein [Acidobacteriota bacterium]